MSATEIRKALVDEFRRVLKDEPEEVAIFNGLPAFVDGEEELPAVSVHLSDIADDDEYLDDPKWRAVLHVTVFVKSSLPDSTLDSWASRFVFPVVPNCRELLRLCSSIDLVGCTYDRSDVAATWAALDVKYNITFKWE
ncbi:phage tail protein [Edwardsiella piscicida]|nr:phage tail protein [Edwardsiella piscicida]ELV7535533.1 phage tail protein [Edwardsiella piscicida]